jgi:rSAM/selenodomain-associated transferase 2
MISVIIPTLNEAATVGTTLDLVSGLPRVAEVLVVDGGSTDGTQDLVRSRGIQLFEAPRGRGIQMHRGAAAAAGEILWFLHADTHPPQNASDHIHDALCDPVVVGGHFAIRFDGTRRAARLLTWLYPRLRLLGLCYGDSGIFVRRAVYEQVGGFRPFPIFEDIDLLRRLKRCGRFISLSCVVETSSRRFERHNFALTFTRWTVLQALYWVGISPRLLGRLYAPTRDGPARRQRCLRSGADNNMASAD